MFDITVQNVLQFTTFLHFCFSLVVWFTTCLDYWIDFKRKHVFPEEERFALCAVTYWVLLCYWLWRSQ